jgi:UDP-glucose 4-epimerase
MELALEKSGLHYSILRISNVYGPNQPIGRGQGVIAEWIDAITHGREICVFGQLDSTRDYIYIDDVSEAILALSESSLNGIYNVGSGRSHSLRDVITILTDLAKEELRVDYRASRPTDRRNFSLEISKILRVSSWAPKYSLDLGIKLSLESNTAGR